MELIKNHHFKKKPITMKCSIRNVLKSISFAKEVLEGFWGG